jgi:exodeoxyribonuclease V gamma subunit
MAIQLCRSHRAETLVVRLCAALRTHAPDDPFVPLPIVVGSRGMERWLRHEIATRLGIAAQLVFPFPRPALDGAAAWLLGGAEDDAAPFWEQPGAAADGAAWGPAALAFRVLPLLRAPSDPAWFEPVARYLSEGGGAAAGGVAPARGPRPVGARELAFAGEVAAVLDRLLHDRPKDALAWAAAPESAPPRHRWLAALLRDLGAVRDPASPALLHRALAGATLRPTGRALFLFGLSTLGPGDRARIALLARALELHLFLLTPSDRWWADVRSRPEVCRAWRSVTDAAALRALEDELATANPLLSALGVPSRDLQVWLESLDDGYREADPPEAEPEEGAAAAAAGADAAGAESGAEASAAGGGDAAGPSLLARLQGWVLRAEPLAGAGPFPPDDSVSFRSGFGALRQCEVLRDELLGWFAADPTLEPRHVLVMTPDIETYAPLVAAVFARRGLAAVAGSGARTLPAIPAAIADLGLRRTNPVAEVLLQALELAGERVTASRLLDFLALEPVRLRFGLAPADLADLRELVRASGLRWGLDGADRTAVDQPALDQNTVRFALERLALGVLMGDEDRAGLGTVPGCAPHLPPAVPLEVEGRERVARFGQLAAVVRQLAAQRRAWAAPGSAAAWRDRLRAALDALAATSARSAWLRTEVDQRLDELARAAAALDGGGPDGAGAGAAATGDGGGTPLDRVAVLRWLQGGFELPQRGDRPITGAVTVCALEPMRSVPFRVIALLGMDDGRFPRGGPPRTWDPFSDRQPGERDRRTIDRHLLLEALLSARERLIVLWAGRDVRSGEELPAAVPVEELLEVVVALTGRERSALVREDPLQPWSGVCFGVAPDQVEPPPPRSFDERMAHAARELDRIARGEAAPTPVGLLASGDDELPPEDAPARRIDLRTLAEGLVAPQRALLRDRLGLRLGVYDDRVADREPIELDELDAWGLRDRLLPVVRRPDAPDDEHVLDAFAARLAGEGVLPIAAGGRRQLRDELDGARQAVAHFAAVAGQPGAAPLALAVRLDADTELFGSAADVRWRGERCLLEWLTASRTPNDRLQLLAWLHVLVAAAMGAPVVGARLVGAGTAARAARAAGQFLAWDGSPDSARALLADAVAVWRGARRRPLKLFRRTSGGLADVLAGVPDDEPRPLSDPDVRGAAFKAVRTGWEGAFQRAGDRDDVWVAPCFGGYDPVRDLDDPHPEGLVALARRVWLPAKRAATAGAALAEEWAGPAARGQGAA